jgi:hypothetical protein
VRTETITVDPQIAAGWLHQNGNNRPVSQARIRYFEQELKAGRAALTHQGIALDTNGGVQDGQHRLQAIVNTGIPWQLAVTFDAPPENFNVIDRGGGRSLADLMAIRGYRDKNSVAVATLAWQWERGQVSFMGNPRDGDLAVFMERYPFVAHVAKVSESLVAPPKQLSFVNLIADDEEFTRILVTDGPDLSKPAGMLGSLWRQRRKNKIKTDLKLEFAQFVKARNDHEAGRSPDKKYGLKQTEGFPRPEWNPPIPFDVQNEDEDD